jgi:hypothetical protein
VKSRIISLNIFFLLEKAYVVPVERSIRHRLSRYSFTHIAATKYYAILLLLFYLPMYLIH